MDTKTKLIDCFSNIGVLIESQDDVDLKEYIFDSLQFVTAIVEIERVFSIEFPDEMLMYSVFDSLNGLVAMIDSLTEDNNKVNIDNSVILKREVRTDEETFEVEEDHCQV